MPDNNSRTNQRSRVLKSAKIVSANNWSVMDCTLRDVSATGAKLLCGDPLSVAPEFKLLLTKENTIQNARVIWRKDGMLGIEFIGEKTTPQTKLA
jgi:PilZ domain